jgi:hypothetical protein
MLTLLPSPEQVSEAAAGLGPSRTATAWRRALFSAIAPARVSRVCSGPARRIGRDRCRSAQGGHRAADRLSVTREENDPSRGQLARVSGL